MLLTITLTSYAQTNDFDCAKNLNKIPYFARHNNSEQPSDSLQIDIQILKNCGHLDSIDNEILTGPMLGAMMVKLISNGKKTTYQELINDINEFKKSPAYPKFRETVITSRIFEKKMVDMNSFEKDKELLIKLQMQEDEIAKFHVFLKANASEKMTYKEALTKYWNSKPDHQLPERKVIQFSELTDLDNAIKAGKENNKRILIYFTCWACVNSRKMELQILTDNDVKALINQKFVYFAAYVDSRELDETTKSTIGKKHQQLQHDKFKSNWQPQFYIIDDKGQVISEISYTTSTDEFIQFLNKGLK